jgi:hypothetical protein
VSEEVLRADPKLRRKTLIRLVVLAAVGAVVLGCVLPWFLEFLREAKSVGTIRTRVICYGFLVFLSGLAVLVAGFGFGVVRDGRKVVHLEQFPLPDAVVLRDTRILRGQQARLVGKGNVFLGWALILCASALLALSAYAAFMIAIR